MDVHLYALHYKIILHYYAHVKQFPKFFLIFRIFDDFEQCPHVHTSSFSSIWCMSDICRYTRICADEDSPRELTVSCQKAVRLLKTDVEILFADMSKHHFQQPTFLYSTVNSDILNTEHIFQHSFQQSAETVLVYQVYFLYLLHIKIACNFHTLML